MCPLGLPAAALDTVDWMENMYWPVRTMSDTMTSLERQCVCRAVPLLMRPTTRNSYRLVRGGDNWRDAFEHDGRGLRGRDGQRSRLIDLCVGVSFQHSEL